MKKRYLILILLTLITLALPLWILIELLILPDVKSLSQCLTTTLYQVKLCPKNNNYTPLSKISEYLKRSVLVSEDASFYSHEGFDWEEIQLSLQKNLEKKKFVRGGSTISQQLIKNVFLSSDKTIIRKLKELYLTYYLEKEFSKNQILEKYLNVIEFGPQIYGVKKAALYYFKKEPEDLNILESAFLTFLLPNPKVYQKSFKKGKLTPYARSRVFQICKTLYKVHRISQDDFNWVQNHIDDFPWDNIRLPSEEYNSEEFNDDSESINDFSDNSLTSPISDQNTQNNNETNIDQY